MEKNTIFLLSYVPLMTILEHNIKQEILHKLHNYYKNNNILLLDYCAAQMDGNGSKTKRISFTIRIDISAVRVMLIEN